MSSSQEDESSWEYSKERGKQKGPFRVRSSASQCRMHSPWFTVRFITLIIIIIKQTRATVVGDKKLLYSFYAFFVLYLAGEDG